jgi:hypothetical protein
MSKRNKLILYSILLVIGLSVFILEVFVFQKPDGIVGLMICITSILLIFGSIVKLCKLSQKFEDGFWKTIDILFWLP